MRIRWIVGSVSQTFSDPAPAAALSVLVCGIVAPGQPPPLIGYRERDAEPRPRSSY